MQKASGIPRALLNNIKFNRVMHEQVVLLTVVTREQPRIAAAKRLTVTPVCEGIVRIVAQVRLHGEADITADLAGRREPRRALRSGTHHVFLEPRGIASRPRSDLTPLRRRAFMQMARNAQVIADYYGLPPGRVIEIGTRLEI